MTQETNKELLQEIQILLLEIKAEIDSQKLSVNTIDGWIPRDIVKVFLAYGNTKMSSLEHDYDVVVSKIGNRKFYHKDSLIQLLQDNIL